MQTTAKIAIAMSIKVRNISGHLRHYAVGAIVKRSGNYLLFERNNLPYGLACSCGHVDQNETVNKALERELFEETGFSLISKKLVFNKLVSIHPCRYDGVWDHMNYIFEVEVSGDLRMDKNEFKRYGWYKPNEIAKLNLEPIWKIVFRDLKII